MTERKEGSIWMLSFSVLLTITIALYAFSLTKKERLLQKELQHTKKVLTTTKEGIALQMKLPYTIRQQSLVISDLRQLNTDVSGKASPFQTPRLIFYYNEHSCNICVDESLELCREQIPNEWLTGIGYAGNEKMLDRFIRMNHIRFPFFFDSNKQFMIENRVPGAPAFLLVDENGIIVDAIFPKYNQKDLTNSFFSFAFDFLSSRLPDPDKSK